MQFLAVALHHGMYSTKRISSAQRKRSLKNLMQENLEVLIDKESMVTEYGIQVWILEELSSSQYVRRATEEFMAFLV